MSDWILQCFEDSKNITYENYKSFMDYIITYPKDDIVIAEIHRTLKLFKNENDSIVITYKGYTCGKLTLNSFNELLDCIGIKYNI